jgi:hypothetical protein
MALLSKDAIWQAQDIKTVDIPVPEWGGTVRLRGLTGSERDAFEALSVQLIGANAKVNQRNLRARLITACAIDEDGAPLFDKSDVIHLGTKSAVALERLFEACLRLNGMTTRDVDDLTENLDDAQNDNSISD